MMRCANNTRGEPSINGLHQRLRPRACAASVRALIAIAALIAPAVPASTSVALSGVVTVADGEPVTIIRGDRLMTGSKGVTLQAGDFVETPRGNAVVVELRDGAVVAFGPSTKVYLVDRADAPTLVVLRGWLKADVHGPGNPNLHRVFGPRCGVASGQGVFVLHVGDREDEVFAEAGAMTVLLPNKAGGRTERETKVNQFLVAQERGVIAVEGRPSAAFIAAMPIAFRDPLPAALSKANRFAPAEPRPTREVDYADVQDWLTMPHEWRPGLLERFRGRLKDPAFLAGVEAHLTRHPEWAPILHPPPPASAGDEQRAKSDAIQPQP
jgi:hypothetical protein